MKKTSWKRIWLFLLTAALLPAVFGLFSVEDVQAASADLTCISPEGSNIEDQDYIRAASTVNSYLTRTDSGYMRVQAWDDNDAETVTVLYYDTSFNRTRRVDLPQELPIFGGFYSSGSNYYIVTGQSNYDEDNSTEVFRVTKYDTDWNRLGSCGLYGANTSGPFSAGSCRMAMDGKWLLVRTCHTMYKSSDGLRHQANVMMEVNTDNMSVTQSYTAVGTDSYGYVSHSFNQFIQIEGHNAIAVDHGDAYPRSLCLLNYSGDVTTGAFKPSGVSVTTIMSFPGEEGNNYTGASAGGFAISSSHYLVAGNSVVQDSSNTSRETRNIFVAAVNKSSKAVTLNWLTDYEEGEETCSTPQFVKTGTDQYMVLWSRGGKVFYTTVGADGSRKTEILSMEGQLSDCVPLVSDGKVIWYTNDEGEETFYQIPLSTGSPTVTERSYGHDDELLSVNNGHVTVQCKKCGRQTEGEAPTSFYVYWREPGDTSGSYWSWPQFELLKGGGADFAIDSISYGSSTGTRFSAFDGESSDPENFVLDMKNRTILFKEAGTYSVTFWARYNPDVRRTITFDVRKPLESVYLEANKTGAQTYGTSLTLTASPDGGLTDDLSCRFVQTDPEGVETELYSGYSRTCTWTPPKAGTYQLQAEMTDPEDDYRTVSSNIITVVINKASISGAAVTGLEDQVWTGSAITPQPTVKLKGRTLAKGTDYTLSYSNNVDIGTATVTITGKGNYTGTVSATFQILEKLPETLTLTADKSGTVSSEVEVKLTAIPENCERILLYRFMQEDPDGIESQLEADDEEEDIYWWYGAKAGTYRLWVVATDKNDKSWSMTSNEIELTVEIKLEQPFITRTRWTTSISEGGTATFYVEAIGGELHYQWYYLKPGATEWKAVSSASGKTQEYSLVTEARHNGYQYRCVVSNDVGEAVSSTVTLEVIPAPVYVDPPRIISQPAAKAVVSGKKATFTVGAVGDDLTYQWYYSKDAGKTWTAVTASAGKKATYSFTTAAKHNGYRYRCKVSNSEGTVTSSSVKLTVITKPKITTQPTSKSVKVGKTVKFTVKATGEKLSYQWYYSKNAGKTWNKITAAAGKKATYSFKATKAKNGYRYKCVVTNAAGKVTSKVVKLTVKK